MAVYSYTTTAADEAALDWILARENERRARKGQSSITKAQLFDVGTRRLWTEYYRDQRELDRDVLRNALAVASETDRDAVRTTLASYITERMGGPGGI
jgi:hypothetical protein